jgi:hypothetical protein
MSSVTTTVNVNESLDLDGEATHQVRVHYNESDAGQVTGPFTLAGARQAALVALGKAGVLKATVEAL